jgi:NADP-dependent 3-hydroxy acid dehydrogenase YdfG
VIEGKAVAVVGALSEFGTLVVQSFAARGAALALADREAEPLAALARSLEDDGARALALPADVGDERQARAFVEHAYEHLGRLDVLVNAAGVVVGQPVQGGDTEAWRALVRVNVMGALYCVYAALPVMRVQRSGHLVMVVPRGTGAVDELARSAVVGFSAALREEVAPLGIAVVVVEAGPDVADAVIGAVEAGALAGG